MAVGRVKYKYIAYNLTYNFDIELSFYASSNAASN